LGDGNPGLYQIGKLLDAIGLQIEIGAKKIWIIAMAVWKLMLMVIAQNAEKFFLQV
jgi:hypothetical protein